MLAVVAGLMLVGAGLYGLHGLDQDEVSTVGAQQAAELATAPARAGPAVPVRSGRPADQLGLVVPRAVRIDTLQVTAEVERVGMDRDTGQLTVPSDGNLLGWYQYGPDLRAATGSMVIVGHVDTESGPGAFFRLGHLQPGDVVTVTGSDGGDHEFEVVAREAVSKRDIALERYFTSEGVFRLTLITCGGPFERDSGRYRDNIVVTAVPVEQGSAGSGAAQQPRR